ncbi:hypothetical protein RT717_09090 [Imperialibacter roseus]|uniref:Uncharacterized protein n=1 Tax=Imperialibacter roseus TaxID=1324217 RepID=A0ABZ0IXC5_9BACT|nr:hypothetical protein [Imperialibacter roseus]WOK08789.1 hypothetical protein RT717_09090 [Imperialibacter roseus]
MSEEARLELILESVNYCKRVEAMGMPASAYTKALREPIHFLWERRNGTKLQAAMYRSLKSIDLKFGSGQLIYDHAIPFNYVQKELLQSSELSISKLREILDRSIVICVITKEEDRLLRSLGLAKKMPEGWNGEDRLARYKAANIEVKSDHNKAA